MESPRHRPTVAVIGSHSDEHRELADPLGQWLATLGVNLLTGGGPGVMESVSRAFANGPATRGAVIGVIPAAADTHGERRPPLKDGYPNPHVEIPILTHLHRSGKKHGKDSLSRNHINVLSAQVVIALPGSGGTQAEFELAEAYGVPARRFEQKADLAKIKRFVSRHITARSD